MPILIYLKKLFLDIGSYEIYYFNIIDTKNISKIENILHTERIKPEKIFIVLFYKYIKETGILAISSFVSKRIHSRYSSLSFLSYTAIVILAIYYY